MINYDGQEDIIIIITRCWLFHYVDDGEGEIVGESIGPRYPYPSLTKRQRICEKRVSEESLTDPNKLVDHGARYLTVLHSQFFNDIYSRMISPPINTHLLDKSSLMVETGLTLSVQPLAHARTMQHIEQSNHHRY